MGGSYRERYIPMVPPEVKLVADSLVELPPDRAPRALPVPAPATRARVIGPVTPRPHVLGVDDAPFTKAQRAPVPIVGVLMEGPDLVEGVAIGAFPVDGDDATRYLADWIGGLRIFPGVQAVMLGGITIAGLGVVDLDGLAERLARPVLAVTRHDPSGSELRQALQAAGLTGRLDLLARSPPAVRAAEGLFVSCAGLAPAQAEQLVRAMLRKSRFPEPLRLAHLIARALVTGESRGRV